MVLRALLLALSASLAAANPDGYRRGDEAPFVHIPVVSPEDYASGKVHMGLMDAMNAAVDRIRADIDPPFGVPMPRLNLSAIREYTPCVGGYAGKQVNNTYACKNVDLYSFTPHRELGSVVQVGNDIWGWEHIGDDGKIREFGLVGQDDGTAFVELLLEGQVAYLGRLPTQTVKSVWRDIKVIGDFAYIGSEAEGHGIQVFDLLKVRCCVSDRMSLIPRSSSTRSSRNRRRSGQSSPT